FLEALRLKKSNIRFYNAGSSEIFGDTEGRAANESTAYHPKSPYGVAKAAAVSLVANYRDAYGLFACSGLLFNHESPLRPDHFATRKITAAAARIANGSDERLKLGDISIHRDWGWAPDYVEAMWMMLQHDRPEDFVIASGVSHRLDEFVSAAVAEVGLVGKTTLNAMIRSDAPLTFAIRGATPRRRHGNSAGDQGSALQR